MSLYVNTVTLAGNLTRDPTIDIAGGGDPLARCSLALNRRYRTANGEQREEVTFVELEAWGKTAQHLAKDFHKGASAVVEGRLRQVRPDNRSSYLVVTVRRIQHGASKRSET
jgi:single-strand DNA-binding protein